MAGAGVDGVAQLNEQGRSDMKVQDALCPGRRARTAAMRLAAISIAIAWIGTGPAYAQDKGDLWEVTTKIEMVGMPFSLPAQTQRLCSSKARGDEGMIPKNQGCSVSDVRRTGNRVTFKMTCTGQNAMSGDGEMTSSATSYDGIMRLKGQADGQDMAMTHTFSGKRVGDC
jgi:hypothetical protein